MTPVKRLQRDGRIYAYRDVGEGLPTLWLHAFPVWGASFEAQWKALSSTCRLIIPDHRGFGDSGLGEGPSTMEALADDALYLLDALKIERAVVAGVSMGGYAAMALTQLDPGRVQGLLLIDTQMGADDAAGKRQREATAQAIEAKGAAHLLQALAPRLLSPAASTAQKAQLAEWISQANPAALTAAVRGMALRTDSRNILARFQGPACVVVGSADVITPVEKARAMVDLINGAQLEIIEGAGHLSMLEAPEQFNAVARNFLSAPLTPFNVTP